MTTPSAVLHGSTRLHKARRHRKRSACLDGVEDSVKGPARPGPAGGQTLIFYF